MHKDFAQSYLINGDQDSIFYEMYPPTLEEVQLPLEPGLSCPLDDIARFLSREGIDAYLVGGFVRNILLGRKTADIDIAVAGDSLQWAQRAAAVLGGTYVALDEPHGIGRVVGKTASDSPGQSWYFDFTSLRGNIEEDLAQRDFTIDAMALPLKRILGGEKWAQFARSNLIDPFRGRSDLEAGIIRAVSPSVFEADPARLLRAVRLSAQLGFTIESDTESLVRKDSGLIAGVAGERVRDEMVRMLAVPGSSRFLIEMDRLGLLTALIPELGRARGVEQPVVHYWDVFQHSLQTAAAADFLLGEDGYSYAGPEALAMVPWSPQLREHFGREVGYGTTRRILLKIGALLHDIAKPETKFVDEAGHTRFFGHTFKGATTASAILSRLRFSSREIKVVELLIAEHMRPNQMAHEQLPTRHALYRFFRDAGESSADVLFLSLADHLAARGPGLDLDEWRRHTDLVRYILDQQFAEAARPAAAPLINGHDIMAAFGLPPGPELGRILEAVREARAAGEIADRDEALNYAKTLIDGKSAS